MRTIIDIGGPADDVPDPINRLRPGKRVERTDPFAVKSAITKRIYGHITSAANCAVVVARQFVRVIDRNDANFHTIFAEYRLKQTKELVPRPGGLNFVCPRFASGNHPVTVRLKTADWQRDKVSVWINQSALIAADDNVASIIDVHRGRHAIHWERLHADGRIPIKGTFDALTVFGNADDLFIVVNRLCLAGNAAKQAEEMHLPIVEKSLSI